MTFGPLISPEWLLAHAGEADVKIVDGSSRLPGQGKGIDAYLAAHLPGAVYFDIDVIADKSTGLPHMLPSPEMFAAAVGAFGIRETDRVVVYDDKGFFAAPRVWWMFRMMGHDRVAVLDGGLPAWIAAGGATTTAIPEPAAATYRPGAPRAQVADAAAIQSAIAGGAKDIIDARSAERFSGKAPEIRPGMRSGHMPGAKNLPYTQLQGPDGRFLDTGRIRAAFEQAGVNLEKPVLASCGSGVTAAVLYLALELIGHEDHAVYDGSWTEWGDERHDDARFPVVREHVG
ncbi:MAG: sulfurtransferase [Parvularculaceae bacterium]